MTAARIESAVAGKGTERGQAAGWRTALAASGLEPPVAAVVVDVVGEATGSLMTREEADARFESMLREHRAEREQDRAEVRAGFARVYSRFEAVEARMDGLEGRMEGLEGRMEGLEKGLTGRMDGLEGRMGGLEQGLTGRMDGLEQGLTGRMDGLEQGLTGRMDGLLGELRTLKWTFGSVLALQTLVLGVFGYLLAA